MDYSRLPANSITDIAIVNKFSTRTLDSAGYLNPFPYSNNKNSLVNAFQSITLPEASFDVEAYWEAGWNSPKQVNSGYVEWGELTLSRGFINPIKGNPTYDIFFNTRYGFMYRMNFLIYIYDSRSISNYKTDSKKYSRTYNNYLRRLEASNKIIYAVIKGATPTNVDLITELDSEGTEINISEATFAIEDMFLGVYDNRGD